jgi:cytochrome c oxidase subunit 3
MSMTEEDGMSQDAAVHTLHPEIASQHQTAYIGMVIFLGSWAVMFAGLFFAFAMHRVNAAHWPPASLQSVPFGLPVASTVLIALSSMALARYGRLVSAGQPQEQRRWLLRTIALGVTFCGVQGFLWYGVHTSGLIPSSGHFVGHLYLMTGFHGLHVLVGVGLLLRLIPITDAGPSPRLATNARLVSMFWHFVGVAWFLIFLLLFVL